jgi:hypothetical protein
LYEDEAVAEDEAAWEDESQTFVEVPIDIPILKDAKPSSHSNIFYHIRFASSIPTDL